MDKLNWDSLASAESFRGVIDSADAAGIKNSLIDRIQWSCISKWLPGQRYLLDFGCGVGRFAQRLTASGVKYVGIDTSVAMIDAARRLAASEHAQYVHVAELPLPFP